MCCVLCCACCVALVVCLKCVVLNLLCIVYFEVYCVCSVICVLCLVLWCGVCVVLCCVYVLSNDITGSRLSYLLQMSPSQTARVLVSVLGETVAAFDEDTAVDSTNVGVR